MLKRRTLTWLAAGCAVLAVLAVVLAVAVTSGTASWLLVSSAVALLTAGAGLWLQARSTRPS
jgi:hypothetical protein